MFTFKYEDGSVKSFTKQELEDIAIKRVIARSNELIKKKGFVSLYAIINNEIGLTYDVSFYKRLLTISPTMGNLNVSN